MRLRIGQRGSLGVQAEMIEHVGRDEAQALRATYRTLRRQGVSPMLARSAVNTCYAVGVAAQQAHLDEWERRRSALDRAVASGSMARHPSARVHLTVVPS